MTGEEKDILREIRCRMEQEDQEEVVVKVVKELKKSTAKSIRSSEWSMENGLLYYRGKIYVPRPELHHWILGLCHDSKIAGHPGRWKTLELVSQNYWWPQMSRYVRKYVSTCDMCLSGDTLTSSLRGTVCRLSYLDLILSQSPVSSPIPTYQLMILI